MTPGSKPDEVDAPSESAPEFDSLLRRAAYVSTVALNGGQPRSRPSQTLGSGRFQLQRRIGEGGMGVVYEAYDEVRRETVALKMLSRFDAQSIYRLKQEFRSVADVTHPSLCRLHELFSEDEWFFTMELVGGERFDRWVRPDGALDEARLRSAVAQLTGAIAVIHGAGKLHRDLKPSNVLVTPEGRVVVLDFGLAVNRELGGLGRTLPDQSVSGTPAYMAPEQAIGGGAIPASDFYALGVMLFEALTGQRPFEGEILAILTTKLHAAAPRVHERCPEAPSELAALCDALIERDPARRPDASAVQSALGRPSLVAPGP